MYRLIVTIAAIVVAIIAGPASAVFAQASDPASVMEAFNNASTDPEAAVQLLADDVTLRIVPPPPGQTGVWHVDGATVSGTVMVTNRDFTALGVAPVEHTLEAVVEDGEITAWTSVMSPAERERVGAALAAQQPGTMPSTGGGGSAGTRNGFSMFALAGIALSLGLALRLVRARLG